jgi:23S rRNA (guanosine2251-2'-O)-methyltransferase
MRFIYGIHSVTALLTQKPQTAGELLVLQGQQNPRLTAILALAEKNGLTIKYVPRKLLDELTQSGIHQGVAVQTVDLAHYTEANLFDLLSSCNVPPLLLILDGVQDPHNLGACLRSANAAGADAVIIPKDKSAGLTPIAYKAASGAAECTPLISVTNLARVIGDLKQFGIWIYGASDKASDNLYQADLSLPIAWVLGSEGKGMRRLTLENCDQLFKIPMQGTVSSLNVSAATAVCLFETVRQRWVKS